VASVLLVAYRQELAAVQPELVVYTSAADRQVSVEPVLAVCTSEPVELVADRQASVAPAVDKLVLVEPEQMRYTMTAAELVLVLELPKTIQVGRLMRRISGKKLGWISVRNCNLDNTILEPLRVDHNLNKKYRQVHMVYYRTSKTIQLRWEPLA
jgi:hypothetical protein